MLSSRPSRPEVLVYALAIIVMASCAEGQDTPNDVDASSGTRRDSGKEGGPGGDCTLGTPSDCGACGKACPGSDTDSTALTCTSTDEHGVCDILCRGEFYDVDGKADNGCEAEDVLQDSEATAVTITLPDVPSDPASASNPRNVIAVLLQDGRSHETAPVLRPLGREDWFKVTAVGAGSPSDTMVACLSAVNFPTDNEIEICIAPNGSSTFPSGSCKTLVVTTDGGGGAACVKPTGTPDNGTFLVRIRKTKGSATRNGYALYLNH